MRVNSQYNISRYTILQGSLLELSVLENSHSLSMKDGLHPIYKNFQCTTKRVELMDNTLLCWIQFRLGSVLFFLFVLFHIDLLIKRNLGKCSFQWTSHTVLTSMKTSFIPDIFQCQLTSMKTSQFPTISPFVIDGKTRCENQQQTSYSPFMFYYFSHVISLPISYQWQSKN